MSNLTTASERDRAHKMMPVVQRMARRLVKRLPSSVELDDLVGAGLLGLTLAIRRCSEEPEQCFEAYARSRIRGEMLEELRRMDPLSRHQRLHVRRVERAEQTLRQRSGAGTAPKVVAAEAGMTEDSYREATMLRAAGSPQGHLDVHEAQIPANSHCATDVADLLDKSRSWQRLEHAIDTLPARLRRVLADHAEGKTLQQIGVQLGVSEARVCQLRGRALKLVRQRSSEPVIPRPARLPTIMQRVA